MMLLMCLEMWSDGQDLGDLDMSGDFTGLNEITNLVWYYAIQLVKTRTRYYFTVVHGWD